MGESTALGAGPQTPSKGRARPLHPSARAIASARKAAPLCWGQGGDREVEALPNCRFILVCLFAVSGGLFIASGGSLAVFEVSIVASEVSKTVTEVSETTFQVSRIMFEVSETVIEVSETTFQVSKAMVEVLKTCWAFSVGQASCLPLAGTSSSRRSLVGGFVVPNLRKFGSLFNNH